MKINSKLLKVILLTDKPMGPMTYCIDVINVSLGSVLIDPSVDRVVVYSLGRSFVKSLNVSSRIEQAATARFVRSKTVGGHLLNI